MAQRSLSSCRIANYYRFDFFFAFLAFFPGSIFLTAFLTFLTADFAAPTTRLVTDFFFDFFHANSSAFGFFRFRLLFRGLLCFLTNRLLQG
jgi:hypothetical protein